MAQLQAPRYRALAERLRAATYCYEAVLQARAGWTVDGREGRCGVAQANAAACCHEAVVQARGVAGGWGLMPGDPRHPVHACRAARMRSTHRTLPPPPTRIAPREQDQRLLSDVLAYYRCVGVLWTGGWVLQGQC